MSKSVPVEDFMKQWYVWVLPFLEFAREKCLNLMVDAEKALLLKQEIEAIRNPLICSSIMHPKEK